MGVGVPLGMYTPWECMCVHLITLVIKSFQKRFQGHDVYETEENGFSLFPGIGLKYVGQGSSCR